MIYYKIKDIRPVAGPGGGESEWVEQEVIVEPGKNNSLSWVGQKLKI